jgi:hypothetical protein
VVESDQVSWHGYVFGYYHQHRFLLLFIFFFFLYSSWFSFQMETEFDSISSITALPSRRMVALYMGLLTATYMPGHTMLKRGGSQVVRLI